ncbi:ion channel [Gloeobacter kilaueensis]|uniref:ion channel n=1 Tax=Gloeobacter kilaueensis TaxID=1416614 RepID=UPI00059C02AF|nr:ion channel [Gloeobacter kilaueensis]
MRLNRDGKANDQLRRCFESLGRQEVWLLEDLYLRAADLRGITFQRQRLSRSDLREANLQRAFFHQSSLEGALLDRADCEDAVFAEVDLRQVRSMRGVRLYQAIMKTVLPPPPEVLGEQLCYEASSEWTKAEYVYRQLKEIYKLEGEHDHSGHFYEREMEMRRRRVKGAEYWKLTTLWLTCGYGERPERTVVFAILLIGFFALIYSGLTLVDNSAPVRFDLARAFYFSTITFTTTGYGDIHPVGTARFFAAIEALLGSFTVALFIFVFCRRLTR